MNISPIALFVYNRPLHTQKTLNSLINNYKSKNSYLYIFHDGLKKNANKENIKNWEEVKNIIYSNKIKESFYKVNIISKEQNFGLAKSIKTGINYIFTYYDRIIVIEDDLILSPYFLTYINDALNKYIDKEKIMHIGAYTPPVKIPIKTDFYFLRFASSWGWGTWKRAWDKYEYSCEMLLKNIKQKDFDFNDNYPFYEMLKNSCSKNIDSWAINWNASLFINNALGVYPKKSLVNNFGFDGTGVHCGTDNYHNIKKINTKKINLIDIALKENYKARKAYEKFYIKIEKPSFISKARYKLKLILKNA